MNIKTHSSLNEMMRKGPLTPQTVSEFRDRAMVAVDEAIDTFFKPEREVEEGKRAYDNLSDVERALRSYQGRFKKDSAAVEKSLREAQNELAGKGFEGNVGQTASALPDGKALKDGYRQVRPGYVNKSDTPNIEHEQAKIAGIVETMSQVLPLYASVAMVPGPLSVSLKDHIKETLQWSFESSSHSQSNMQEEAFRLLTLGAGKKVVRGASDSHSESSGKSETTTVDERVLPGLHQIRNALSQLSHAPEVESKLSVRDSVTEWEKVPTTTGVLWWKKDIVQHQQVNSGYLERKSSAVAVPERIRLDGGLGNEGLSRPGEGADLVDLVAGASLDQEFVDKLRERALNVLDGATATLFNTEREVPEGRKRYDELSNLQRAVTLAKRRFGKALSYGEKDHLGEQIALLDKVTPLYACVAMVPGEMSSSVKKHAKELFEATRSASSSSTQRSDEWRVSLLGSLSESRGEAVESSSSSGYVRKETTTTDERIMPVLHELRMELDQLAIETDRKGNSYLTINTVGP